MTAPASPDAWFDQLAVWREPLLALRPLVRAAGLDETLKWKQPCYVDQGKNIALLGHRKKGAVLSFVRGSLLTDPDGLLHQPGTATSRYLLFQSAAEVSAAQATLTAMLAEAIALTRAGQTVERRETPSAWVPELQAKLDADPAFRAAFEGLTPGRQRQYDHHIGGAKQSSTRVDRIARYEARILDGKGLRDCVCGRSQRMPQCDGSHARG